MISSKLDNNPDANGFIFDGFPRTAAQATALDNMLAEKGTSISAMLSLKVKDSELIRRLLERGEKSGRSDDKNEAIIANRIQEYNNKTAPLKEFYASQNKLSEIEGIGSIEDIALKLNNVIDTL
jgi:adenylate kinase